MKFIRRKNNANPFIVISLRGLFFSPGHKSKICVLFFALLFSSFFLHGQVPPKEDDPDQVQNQNLEILSENLQTEDADYTNLVEQLKYFQAHPINLNNTTKEELMSLGLLTELQVNALLDHKEKNGNLISIYELQSVDGFDVPTIRKILPFVEVKDNFGAAHFTFREMLKSGKHEVVTRWQRILENQSGYKSRPPDDSLSFNSPNTFYLGSPDRFFTRYRFTYGNNVSVGFIAEKDAGEAFRKIPALNKKTGFDFYTAHFFLRNIKFIKALAVGDYQASFGQGLVMWRGFGFGKNAVVSSIKRNARGLNQYNSVDENRFLRGAAFTFKVLKHFEATAFYSRKKVDANVTAATDTTGNNLFDAEEISSLIVGGYHTTVGELEDKRKINETILGGNFAYKGKRLNIGTTFVGYNLDASLTKTTKYYNQFDFTGQNNLNAGVDFSYIYSNVNFYGEAAMSKNGGKAFTGGVLAALDPKFNVVLSYRNFDKNYQNVLASAVSENTLPQNENGLFFGFEAKLPGNLSLSSYFDRYKFPWLKFNANAPSEGMDFFSQVNWTPSKKVDMYLRFRNRTRMENTSIENMFDYLVPYNQQNIRYNVSFNILPSVKLRTRIEAVTIQKESEKTERGFIFFQDVVWKKIGFPLTVTARYGMFETDSYTSRLYTYENDVIYSFSVPALYYKGQRAYLMLNYDVTRKFEIWFRVAQTFYTNQTTLNAGDKLTEINAPSKTEIKVQLRLKL
jgi:hypothetical protein